MNKPLLSITIPTYNRSKDFKICLESIKNNMLENPTLNDIVEVVISDNASKDDTTEVAESYRSFFKNFVYTRNNENVGFDLNVLNVVKHATGTYCWYLGDDDSIVSRGLSLVVNCLKDNKYDVVTIQSHSIIEGETVNIVANETNPSLIEVDNGNEFYFKSYCEGGFSVLLFNREMWFVSVNTADFLPYWLYYETVLKMLIATKKKMLAIREAVIMTGQDCRWAENGSEIFTFVNSILLRERMIGFGFDKERILHDIEEGSKSMLIILLRAKGHGLKCNYKNLKYIYTNLKKMDLPTKILIPFIYKIPNKIIVFIRDTRKSLVR